MESQSIQQVNAELLQRLIQHGPVVQSDIQVHREEPMRARGPEQTNTEGPSITTTTTVATATATAVTTTEAPLRPEFEPRMRFMVEGRIIHKRKLSRKLFFLDLSLSRRKQRAPQLPEIKDVVTSTPENGPECDTQEEGTSAPKESEWEDVLPEQESQKQGEEPNQSTGRSRGGLQRMEVIGRYPTHSLKDLDDLWHRVQLGAVVRVFGDIELSERRSSAGLTTEDQDRAATSTGHQWSVLLHVLDFEVLEVWQGKDSFEPNPGSAEMGSSKKGFKKQQQQQQQQPLKKNTGSKKRKSSDLGEPNADKIPLDRGDASQSHCKFWLNSGKCNKQKCDFWHETDQAKLKIERRRWVEERIQAKRQISHHSCDPHQSTTKNQHRERSLYFAQWLIHTFTREFLESGSGVLDIAGGRGDLSWELQTRQGVRSTVIEPRPGKGMRKWQRKWLEKFVAENQSKGDKTNTEAVVTKGRDVSVPQKEEEDQARDGSVTKKQKMEVGEDKDKDDDDDDGREPDVGDDKDTSLINFIPTVKTYTLQTTEPARIQAMMDDAFLQTHRELVASASVLIGLHPDQATEPIVRAALKAGKPFAIIPCCVFGRDNPHRRLPLVALEGERGRKNGEGEGGVKEGKGAVQVMDVDQDQETGTRAVTSYEDFVTWLMTLHPGIETTWLNFEGMNRVLFWRGCSDSRSK
ncbi:hypothetical protein BG006_004099 [Podila minutissima]|uniref:C3H1-type domain-containing protein n=1 Tax=Podila minutissima TaxID=64525 RepID=A0A9P5SP16_9FUNG|nr:hypothetical protein BG006_004099 [Podila minutissima]